jgi:hypothetical protein
MAAPNRDSSFNEMDRLLDDEEFCAELQALYDDTGETKNMKSNE